MPDNTKVDSRNMVSKNEREWTRMRPAPVFGTNDEVGAFNAINEIIANSVDEAREGHGNSIKIKVEPDYVITVEDHGRGLPMKWNEQEQKYNWKMALCELRASGKFDDKQYNKSLGLNGLGLTSTQYASKFMDVYSTYDNETYIMHFKEGEPVGTLQAVPAMQEGTGTTIKFQIDDTVFLGLKGKTIPVEKYVNMLRRQAMLIDGLEIIFEHYELKSPVRLYYEHGIQDFVDDTDFIESHILPHAQYYADSASGTDVEGTEPYKVYMRVAFNFSRDANLIELYHNNSWMFEGGVTQIAFENNFTKAFTDYARENGKLNRTDKFSYKDIQTILVAVACTDAPGNRTFFKNQTKGAINNEFIGMAFGQFIYEKLNIWLDNNKAQADKILNEVLANKVAREEADKVSKKVIGKLSKAVTFGSKPKDFSDCSSKNVFNRELYIVEGRSALGSVKLARDPSFQAVIPARGKPINCLKEQLSTVLNNDIITDIYRVLGCGMEAKSEYITDLPEFDIDKLNWGKIIICTDADVDGKHIRCLLITMFYILSPTLLKKGKVYIAETPLFEITYKGQTAFAFDEQEKAQIMQKLYAEGIKDSQISIQRSKGLGENDADMMAKSTMNPLSRRLVPVEYPGDDKQEEMVEIFKALLGDDLEDRRTLIDQYFDMTEDDDTDY